MVMNDPRFPAPSRKDAPKEAAVMDSPEALGLALCHLLPEMSQGFIIQTHSGEIQVSAANSLPFVTEMNRLLKREIALVQRQAYRNAGITPSDMPDLTSVIESRP